MLYPNIDITDTYSAYACSSDTMTLSCPNNQTILLTSAYYGSFNYTCAQSDLTCCPPQTRTDCTEVMAETSAESWLALQILCDGQQSCEFVIQEDAMMSCSADIADYLTVFYQCQPGNNIVYDVSIYVALYHNTCLAAN